jgi:cytochrome P450
MILSELLRRYDFELVPGQEIEERAMVILRPKNGIKMRFAHAAVAKKNAASPAEITV